MAYFSGAKGWQLVAVFVSAQSWQFGAVLFKDFYRVHIEVHTMAENFYGCIYFPSDKTVAIIPKSHCILRDKFKELCEVEVKWRVQGKQQTFLGIILHTCPKCEYNN